MNVQVSKSAHFHLDKKNQYPLV